MAESEVPVAVEEKETLDAEACFLWTFDRFLSLGFQEELAELLAREKVDWHRVQKMMDAGCSQNQVLKICL